VTKMFDAVIPIGLGWLAAFAGWIVHGTGYVHRAIELLGSAAFITAFTGAVGFCLFQKDRTKPRTDGTTREIPEPDHPDFPITSDEPDEQAPVQPLPNG
jgi:hypothetical protein